MIMKFLLSTLWLASLIWISLSQNDLAQLRTSLLEDYDVYRVPHAYPNNATQVKLGLVVRGFEIDEKYINILLNGWIRMVWDDPRLLWNPDEFGGIKQIRFKPKEIWIPDILPYTSAEAHTIAPPYQMTDILVNETGSVIWVPPTTLKIKCKSETYWWPRDSLTCYLKLGPWTYSHYEVQVNYYPPRSDEPYAVKRDGDWTIEKLDQEVHVKYYDCCPEPYSHIMWTLSLERQGVFYMATLGSILIVVVILTLLLFFFPVRSLAKVAITLFNLLLLSVMLFFCNIFMPIPEKEETPAAMRLLIGLAAIEVIILITEIVVFNLLHEVPGDCPLRPIFKYLGLRGTEKKPQKEEIELQKGEKSDDNDDDDDLNSPSLVAVRINQIGFALVFIILLIICICLWSF